MYLLLLWWRCLLRRKPRVVVEVVEVAVDVARAGLISGTRPIPNCGAVVVLRVILTSGPSAGRRGYLPSW